MPRSSALRLLVLILLILLAIGCAIFLFGTQQGHDLRHHPKKLHDWVTTHRLLVVVVFIAVYLIIAIVAMPVWWLQILSGYCFGLIGGIFMSQICYTLAAVITCKLSNWLAGQYVHEKLEARREKLRKLYEKLGHNWLLVVMAYRLCTIVPLLLDTIHL